MVNHIKRNIIKSLFLQVKVHNNLSYGMRTSIFKYYMILRLRLLHRLLVSTHHSRLGRILEPSCSAYNVELQSYKYIKNKNLKFNLHSDAKFNDSKIK